MAKHPNQPLVVDDHGVIRFKDNPIVSYMLFKGSIDMNHLAVKGSELGWTEDDKAHFAQLIGYSHSGWGSLSYVTDERYESVDTEVVTDDDS